MSSERRTSIFPKRDPGAAASPWVPSLRYDCGEEEVSERVSGFRVRPISRQGRRAASREERSKDLGCDGDVEILPKRPPLDALLQHTGFNWSDLAIALGSAVALLAVTQYFAVRSFSALVRAD